MEEPRHLIQDKSITINYPEKGISQYVVTKCAKKLNYGSPFSQRYVTNNPSMVTCEECLEIYGLELLSNDGEKDWTRFLR